MTPEERRKLYPEHAQFFDDVVRVFGKPAKAKFTVKEKKK